MFNSESQKYVNLAIEKEVDQAKENYGSVYASKHEAYAVLKEEIEEAKENMDQFRKLNHVFWMSVRGMKIQNIKDYSDRKHIGITKKVAVQLALEAIQIAAVCTKIEESLDRDFQ